MHTYVSERTDVRTYVCTTANEVHANDDLLSEGSSWLLIRSEKYSHRSHTAADTDGDVGTVSRSMLTLRHTTGCMVAAA